jgi:hypothetical protein
MTYLWPVKSAKSRAERRLDRKSRRRHCRAAARLLPGDDSNLGLELRMVAGKIRKIGRSYAKRLADLFHSKS